MSVLVCDLLEHANDSFALRQAMSVVDSRGIPAPADVISHLSSADTLFNAAAVSYWADAHADNAGVDPCRKLSTLRI